ncbi:nicotinamide N-methyltransferase-like [Ixodes scapularis]|uniref:nicotinamide N-methyltransferase-like n=1 Tax=Ixodes scapularis TaxID=6945 RepID=UPI001C38C4F8|nr:nicotinamide N-methyltransferase-like [Ixodes scapularis]
MSVEAVREAHLAKFEPRSYAEITKEYRLYTFHQEELHRIFCSDLVQGRTTLLEVGCGPTAAFVLSAAARFQGIVLSDLVEGNRLEVNKWLRNSADAIDWSFRAEPIAALEGHVDIRKGALEIMDRARRAIRKVIPCDVLDPAVLPEDHRDTFDVVLSCNCLESATADLQSYRRALSNVGRLVARGGLLVQAGIGGITSYSMGQETVPMTCLDESSIMEALADAGFRVETFRKKMYDGPDRELRRKRFGFVLAAHRF